MPNRAQHPKPAKMKLNITQTWSLSKTKGKTGKKNLKTSFVFIWKKHLVSCKKRKNLVSMWGGPSHRCYQDIFEEKIYKNLVSMWVVPVTDVIKRLHECAKCLLRELRVQRARGHVRLHVRVCVCVCVCVCIETHKYSYTQTYSYTQIYSYTQTSTNPQVSTKCCCTH